MTRTEKIKQIIKDAKSTFFNVTFIKKNGDKRAMNCIKGVKKHLNGGTLAYNPEKKNLVPVYSIDKKGYRMINLETVLQIKSRGQIYNF